MHNILCKSKHMHQEEKAFWNRPLNFSEKLISIYEDIYSVFEMQLFCNLAKWKKIIAIS